MDTTALLLHVASNSVSFLLTIIMLYCTFCRSVKYEKHTLETCNVVS